MDIMMKKIKQSDDANKRLNAKLKRIKRENKELGEITKKMEQIISLIKAGKATEADKQELQRISSIGKELHRGIEHALTRLGMRDG